jgi:hypothetical protein
MDAALGLGTPEFIGGDFDIAERVMFGTCFHAPHLGCGAEN